MGRPKGSVNKYDEAKSKVGGKTAPGYCPERDVHKCKMYEWYCRKCENFLTCTVWREEEV
jgi:hypothetical protein